MISENYLNLHLRLGYHFNLVDARMEPEARTATTSTSALWAGSPT